MHQLRKRNVDFEEAQQSTGPAGLNTVAERAGLIAGNAVRALGHLQSKFREMPSRVESMKEQGGDLASEWKHIGRLRLNQGRQKAKQLAQDKPFHLVAGVAASAFALGFFLRLWRSVRVD